MRLAVLIAVAVMALPTFAQELSTTVRAARPNADGQSTTNIDPARFAGEWRHAGDLAASAPGAVALEFGGLLSTTTVSLRGGSADQVAVLFDGVALGSPAGGGFDLSRLPAVLLSGMEVRRGADARLGAGAMGGALVLEPVRGSRAMLTAGALGTFGGSISHALEHATDDATWTFLGAADVRRSQGDFEFARDPTPELEGNDVLQSLRRTNNDALLATALARVRRRSRHGELSVLALLSRVERGLPGPVYSPTPTTRQHDWSLVGQLGWKSEQLEVPLGIRAGRLQTGATSRAGDTGLQSFVDTFSTPSMRFEFGHTRLEFDALAGHEWFTGDSHGARSRLRAGLGLEVVHERGRWSGSLALRGERWGDAWGLVPRVGGSVRVASGLTLYANAGAGFRPPSFGELYFSSGPILPNPELVAERAWSADLGARVLRRLGPVAVDAGVTLFGGLYQDTIVYELFSGTRAKPFNLEGSRAGGVELQSTVSPAAGALRPLSLTVSAGWLKTQSLVAGDNAWHKALPYRPSLRGNARLTWADSRVRGSLDFLLTSSAWSNRANTRRVDGYFNFAASAGVRLAGAFWLSAEIKNALDVRDRTVIEGYPLPGRLVLAHVSWEPESSP